jgi:hypothetical protein
MNKRNRMVAASWFIRNKFLPRRSRGFMIIKTPNFVLFVFFVAGTILFPASAFAQAPFFQGKTITIVRGSEPGGVGEMRTRAVANYVKKHVPGNPTVVIEFMPGAGGTKAANHLFRGARTDGLVIAARQAAWFPQRCSAKRGCSTISINLFILVRRTALRIMCSLRIVSWG